MKFTAVENVWLSALCVYNLNDDFAFGEDGDTICLEAGEEVTIDATFRDIDLVVAGSVEPQDWDDPSDVSTLVRVKPEVLIEAATGGQIVPADGEAYDWLIAKGVGLGSARPGTEDPHP